MEDPSAAGFAQISITNWTLGGQFRPLAVGFCLITSGPLAEGLLVSIAATVDNQHIHGGGGGL